MHTLSNGEIAVTSGSNDPVDTFVDHYTNASVALMEVARRFGIAVNYMDRGVVEGKIGRDLTDDEWVKLAPELESYDEWIDNASFASDTQSDFVFASLESAGITIEGGE